MKTSKVLKWICGSLEAFLAIPILGGVVIVSLFWTPLLVMFVLHIVTLVLSRQENEGSAGSILGIVTSVLGWIPFVGWALHLSTAIVLMISAAKKSYQSEPPRIYG